MTYETMISALRKIAASGEVHCEIEEHEVQIGLSKSVVTSSVIRLKSQGGQYTAATFVKLPQHKCLVDIPGLGSKQLDSDEHVSVSAIFDAVLNAEKDRHRAAEERWVQQLLAKP